MATEMQINVAVAGPDDDTLIERWIELDSGRPGKANARVREYGVAVWALIGYQKATGDDAAHVADAYGLPVEAAEAAFAYYRRFPGFIDARLDANAG